MTPKLFKLAQKNIQGVWSSRLLLPKGGENTTTVMMNGECSVLRCSNTLST